MPQFFCSLLGKTVTISTTSSKAGEIMSRFSQKTGIPSDDLYLSFESIVVEGETSIPSGASLQVSLPLLGGKKRRKKNRFSTPKKAAGKIHKKPLNTLNHFNVSKTLEITHTREECPECEPGTFMANHTDRIYCGLCHATFSKDEQKA